MTKLELQLENERLHDEIELLKKLVPITEDKVRALIKSEISEKLKVDIHSHGFESTGIVIKIEYDGSMFTDTKLY